jgi:hypothetical protein
MTNAVAVHEAGHVLVGLNTGRKLLQVWVRGNEGCVDGPSEAFFGWEFSVIVRLSAHAVFGCPMVFANLGLSV